MDQQPPTTSRTVLSSELTSTATESANLQVQPRKRLGRPPKSAISVLDIAQIGDNPDEGTISVDNRSMVNSPTFSECRRSSRKKCMKFDVRDLLNKNRKPHKIQIEARIDSNEVMLVKNAPFDLTATAPPAPSISSTSHPLINRRFSMYEHMSTNRPLPLPKPKTTLEIFTKPKPTQSLIVAQVNSSGSQTSEPIHKKKTHENLLKVLKVKADSPTATLTRKRGRPRKEKASLTQTITTAAVTDMDVNSDPLRSFSYSDSDTNSTSISTASSSESEHKTKGTPKLRVSVKRVTMPQRGESSDSTESTKYSLMALNMDVSNSTELYTPQPLTTTQPKAASTTTAITTQPIDEIESNKLTLDENALDANIVSSPAEQPAGNSNGDSAESAVIVIPTDACAKTDSTTKSLLLMKTSIASELALDENALDANFMPRLSEPLGDAVVAGNSDDSDSQIIFVEVQTFAEKSGEAREPTSFQKLLVDKPEEEQQQEQMQDELITEMLVESSSTCSELEEQQEQLQPTQPPLSQTSASSNQENKRRSPRNSLSIKNAAALPKMNKTLEETFADIASQSSQQILCDDAAAATAVAEPAIDHTKPKELLQLEQVDHLIEEVKEQAEEVQQMMDVEQMVEIEQIVEVEQVDQAHQLDEIEPVELQVGAEEVLLDIAESSSNSSQPANESEQVPKPPLIERELDNEIRQLQGAQTAPKTVVSMLAQQATHRRRSTSLQLLLAAAPVDLGPRKPSRVRLGSNSNSNSSSGSSREATAARTDTQQQQKQSATVVFETIDKNIEQQQQQHQTGEQKQTDDVATPDIAVVSTQLETKSVEMNDEKRLMKKTIKEKRKSKTSLTLKADQDIKADKSEKGEKQVPNVTPFVECDAMFKAIDEMSAEKRRKKAKILEAKKQEMRSTVNMPTKVKAEEIFTTFDKKELPNSIEAEAPTTETEMTTAIATDAVEVAAEGNTGLRKLSHSSDSSSVSILKLGKRSVKKAKNTKRQNTSCEELSDSNDSQLAKRRYSMQSKLSPERSESNDSTTEPTQSIKQGEHLNKQGGTSKATGQTGVAKKTKRPATKSLSRQGSFDSNSSASPSTFKAQRRKASDALLLALTETESLESSSSSSIKSSIMHTPASSSPATRTVTPTEVLEAPDPLKDIAKFIEDGVNLLKRDYKLDDDEDHSPNMLTPASVSAPASVSTSASCSPKTVSSSDTLDEFAERVANLETPALTPEPLSSAPSSPPLHTSISEESNSGGVRRSHRIKKNTPKASVGRGVVRDKDRHFSHEIGDTAVSNLSMEDQLTELAQIEAVNEQFLRSEGLNTFQTIRENYYRCARQVSQENAEMQCDCFLTGDEEAQGHLCCGAGCINRMLMIECGPLCTNGDRCTNKRFQKRQCWPCRVFRTEKKGCGITAELQIPPGEFIMEYVGEVIDSDEFERRQHLYSRDKNRHYYFMALRGEAIIDATVKGNISRYINHSCDPNAETQKWTVNGELRIGFFSRKTIMPGEEITFDYQYQRYGRDAQRCYCESSNCRGWIGNEPDSDEGEQIDGEGDSDSEEDYDEDAEGSMESEQANNRRKPASARKLKEPKAKSLNKLKLTGGRKRKEQPKAKDREYKAGRWLRPANDRATRKPSKMKFNATLEDPDVLEELSMLSRSGLKNQVDTLRFSRCLVRAKLVQTRLQLLNVLTHGELPCRRLFLDYHGLRLLHAWMNESGDDCVLRLALLEALESLPIPNKTMLNDSRVYQSVKAWSSSELNSDINATTNTNTNATTNTNNSSSTSNNSNSPGSGESNANATTNAETVEDLRARMMALLKKWDSLPEIFRIPKRERIEQMKEHEREADGQNTPTALGDSNNTTTLGNDRYKPDRFRRDTSSRYVKPHKPAVMSGNNTICTIITQPKEGRHTPSASSQTHAYKGEIRRRSESGSLITFERPKNISKELRREMFERKVAQDEAEKRVSSEDWREHEARCNFFGADVTGDPKLLPFSQNIETDEWFNIDEVQVPTPLRCGGYGFDQDVDDTPLDPKDWKLPGSVEPLPPSWHWQVTVDGDVFYYNLNDRIPQWEPPSQQQRLQVLKVPDESTVEGDEPKATAGFNEEDLLVKIDPEIVCQLDSKGLASFIHRKSLERRELRKECLVSVRMISPRREEDRVYNQIEMRKYKDNKEKIRRRKELYRRRASVTGGPETTTPAVNSDAFAPLPIQAYLFSSDEEIDTEDMPEEAAEAGSSEEKPSAASLANASSSSRQPLIDVIVDGDKNVDELDALDSQRQLSTAKLSLPLPPLSMEPSTSKSALAALAKKPLPASSIALQDDEITNIVSRTTMSSPVTLPITASTKRKLPLPPVPEVKRNRLERDKLRRNLATSIGGRDAVEKFRQQISIFVSEFLRPYRRETCELGRITSEEDFKFLVKRLSHHVTTKEMRYCDAGGNPLAFNDSVKHKSYEFIKQYMRKKGPVYKRPNDEPEF